MKRSGRRSTYTPLRTSINMVIIHEIGIEVVLVQVVSVPIIATAAVEDHGVIVQRVVQ